MKLTHTRSGDVETLVVDHRPSWLRRLLRLPLRERFHSPSHGVFWYKIHDNGEATPLGTFFGRNQEIRTLARIAEDMQRLSAQATTPNP